MERLPLYCPSCGDSDFYTAAPLPRGPVRWVVDELGRVNVVQTASDVEVVAPVSAAVYCSDCNALVTGSVVARAVVDQV